jgi:hypothetical protein
MSKQPSFSERIIYLLNRDYSLPDQIPLVEALLVDIRQRASSTLGGERERNGAEGRASESLPRTVTAEMFEGWAAKYETKEFCSCKRFSVGPFKENL